MLLLVLLMMRWVGTKAKTKNPLSYTEPVCQFKMWPSAMSVPPPQSYIHIENSSVPSSQLVRHRHNQSAVRRFQNKGTTRYSTGEPSQQCVAGCNTCTSTHILLYLIEPDSILQSTTVVTVTSN